MQSGRTGGEMSIESADGRTQDGITQSMENSYFSVAKDRPNQENSLFFGHIFLMVSISFSIL